MIRTILILIAMAFLSTCSSELSEDFAATPTVKSVQLPTGVKLEYSEQGDSSGVPIIMLHGYGDSRRSFDLVLPRLPKSFHVYALSQRGHGDSDKPASGYNPKDFAADVAAFMDVVKLTQAVIVGHSMGSYVAQRFALDYPERVRGLVLIGSFVTLKGHTGVKELWDTTLSKLPETADMTFIREFQQSTFQKPIPPDFFETVVDESAKVPGRVWRAAMAELMKTDFSDQLGRIKAPTMIVWGDKDAYFLREEQERLAKAIAGSSLLIYEGTGHCPNWEVPERLGTSLAAFIEKFER